MNESGRTAWLIISQLGFGLGQRPTVQRSRAFVPVHREVRDEMDRHSELEFAYWLFGGWPSVKRRPVRALNGKDV